jgi:hypothetical protein
MHKLRGQIQRAQNGYGGNRPIRTRDRIQPEARPTIGTGYLLRDSTWIIGGQLTTQLHIFLLYSYMYSVGVETKARVIPEILSKYILAESIE